MAKLDPQLIDEAFLVNLIDATPQPLRDSVEILADGFRHYRREAEETNRAIVEAVASDLDFQEFV